MGRKVVPTGACTANNRWDTLLKPPEVRSVPVRFDDGSAEGFVPVQGSSYPGGGQPGARAAP